MTAFVKWIYRRNRAVRMVFLALFLAVQLPLTLVDLPRVGTARYFLEVGAGIRAAAAEGWRGR